MAYHSTKCVQMDMFQIFSLCRGGMSPQIQILKLTKIKFPIHSHFLYIPSIIPARHRVINQSDRSNLEIVRNARDKNMKEHKLSV